MEERGFFTTQDHIFLNKLYAARNYEPYPIVFNRAKGSWLRDTNGKWYLDCLTCYSAVPFGQRRFSLLFTLIWQAFKLATVPRAYMHDQFGPYVRDLSALCGKQKVLPMNTGMEGVETAIKAARRWGYFKKGVEPGKAEIIAFIGNFHGRSTTIISFSSEEPYKKGFGPFTPGFKVISYGNIKELQEAITPNTVAVLIEPIQGEGGIIVPPPGYLKEVRRICTENNILMVADEVQTGLGRTGKMFACEHEGVVPDIYILGKALGGGLLPVSAIAADDDGMDVFDPGSHGSTFGGYPLACAVAHKAIKILVKENLAERAEEMGEYFMAGLRRIALKSPYIKEVRGKGLLIGVEIKEEYGGAKPFCKKLIKVGIISKETHDLVLRFAPPLNVSKKEIDWALKQIERVFVEFGN